MRARPWVTGAMLLLSVACNVQPTEAPSRPNVLLIITDQQAARALGASGNPLASTPHIDGLAAAGVRFERSYCTSPVCSPARSSIVTGRMPHNSGVEWNGKHLVGGGGGSIPTLGSLLRKAGYTTAWAGKWHLPRAYEVDENSGFEDLNGSLPELENKRGSEIDSIVAQHAVDFLSTPHDQPFLLVVSLLNPHDICHWAREPSDTSEHSAQIELPDNFAKDPEEIPFIRETRRLISVNTGLATREAGEPDWSEAHWRAYLEAYYGLLEQADAAVGQVLSALDSEGLRENTLVLFTSDHGDGLATHQWYLKGMLYEDIINVPFIVSWEGVTPAGSVDDTHLVSGIDILPTICDYVGVKAPPRVDGMSLRTIIEQPESTGRSTLAVEMFVNKDMRGRALLTRGFKYVAFRSKDSPELDGELLYDLVADPGETSNLALDPASLEVLENHRQHLRDWIAETSDGFRMPRVALQR